MAGSYTVELDEPEDDVVCVCGACDWEGTFADVADIGDCSLTPGDPSPAGRCPEEDCGALCYVQTEKTILADSAPGLLKAVNAVIQHENLHDAPPFTGKAASTWQDVRDLLKHEQANATGA